MYCDKVSVEQLDSPTTCKVFQAKKSRKETASAMCLPWQPQLPRGAHPQPVVDDRWLLGDRPSIFALLSLLRAREARQERWASIA